MRLKICMHLDFEKVVYVPFFPLQSVQLPVSVQILRTLSPLCGDVTYLLATHKPHLDDAFIYIDANSVLNNNASSLILRFLFVGGGFLLLFVFCFCFFFFFFFCCCCCCCFLFFFFNISRPLYQIKTNEPRHDKTNKMSVRPARTQISLGMRPVWSVFSVHIKKAWVLSYPLSAQWRLWSDLADTQANLSLR